MSAIALVGSVTLVVKMSTLERVILPMVAFAAGSLIGGALFHMLPAAIEEMGNTTSVYAWFVAGFLLFLALEQFMNWHHSHAPSTERREPLTYLILIADAVHNLIGGFFVGASFVLDVRLGITAWLVAAAHEVPQELGDFAILIHGGWSRGGALLYNFLSALSFPLGGLIVYFFSSQLNMAFLVPFAAGNFVYIATADLIPEIKQGHDISKNLLHFGAFCLGILILLMIRLLSPQSS